MSKIETFIKENDTPSPMSKIKSYLMVALGILSVEMAFSQDRALDEKLNRLESFPFPDSIKEVYSEKINEVYSDPDKSDDSYVTLSKYVDSTDSGKKTYYTIESFIKGENAGFDLNKYQFSVEEKAVGFNDFLDRLVREGDIDSARKNELIEINKKPAEYKENKDYR